MYTPALRRAYLAGQITGAEVHKKLCNWSDHDHIVNTLLADWDLIKGLQAELKATRLHQQDPRLERSIVDDLIDHAFLTDHIDWQTATDFLIVTGMSVLTADAHIITLEAIKEREAELAIHMADPDTADRYCTICGKRTTADKLSQRAHCEKCNTKIGWEIAAQLTRHNGPYYRKWRKGMLQAMHGLEDEMIRESREREPSTLGDMIDDDKASLCQNDCYDCTGEACRFRVEPYVNKPSTEPF